MHIDGRTVVNDAAGIRYPDKAYYPFVGKAWEATAGREDNLAGGTGKIYLPLITVGTLQPVSMTQDTPISFPPAVVAANPAVPLLQPRRASELAGEDQQHLLIQPSVENIVDERADDVVVARQAGVHPFYRDTHRI